MWTNGTLRALTDISSTLNDYGEVESAETEWGDDMPCSVKVNSDTHVGVQEDGIFRQASYTILIESTPFSAKRIIVTRLGETLGEFPVLAVQPMPTVGRTQILV